MLCLCRINSYFPFINEPFFVFQVLVALSQQQGGINKTVTSSLDNLYEKELIDCDRS